MSNNIPIMSKEYYMDIVADFLREHHEGMTAEEIQEIADYRTRTFIDRMENSKNSMMDKEFFYQEMLEF